IGIIYYVLLAYKNPRRKTCEGFFIREKVKIFQAAHLSKCFRANSVAPFQEFGNFAKFRRPKLEQNADVSNQKQIEGVDF
ncbi:MAG: hypothetical protein ACK57I_09640, partial [Akkermansiaceae bacterium]